MPQFVAVAPGAVPIPEPKPLTRKQQRRLEAKREAEAPALAAGLAKLERTFGRPSKQTTGGSHPSKRTNNGWAR